MLPVNVERMKPMMQTASIWPSKPGQGLMPGAAVKTAREMATYPSDTCAKIHYTSLADEPVSRLLTETHSRPDAEGHKVNVIVCADTVSDPRTVMVHIDDALSADATVVRSRWPDDLTSRTIPRVRV